MVTSPIKETPIHICLQAMMSEHKDPNLSLSSPKGSIKLDFKALHTKTNQ